MERVLNHLRENEQRWIDDLCTYASFPSISAQPKHAPDLLACAEWLAARMTKIGLATRIHPTAGHPIVVARTQPEDPKKPTFLVYGHYDVQPPEPFELWKSPPFQPARVGRNLYARGISDNKGQNLAHLNVVESYLATHTELPCNLIFLIEGEEEVGSTQLASFLKKERRALAADGVVISDNCIPSLKHPALTYALRGIAAMEIRLDGPARDLHSGLFGGTVDNPAMALCQLLGKLRDADGKITIPGFYKDVAKLSNYERQQMAKLPGGAKKLQQLTGVPALFGEKGFTPEEQRTARPTFEINGLTSGYQGEGSKTIIPSWASAKITIRLVPNQKPAQIIEVVKKHLKKLCPPSVRLTVKHGHGGEPYLVSPQTPFAQAAVRAFKLGFGHEALLMREGGSIPIVNQFQKILRMDTLLLGMSLPNDNAHSPNEKFNLDAYAAGMRMAAHLWPELSEAARVDKKRKR